MISERKLTACRANFHAATIAQAERAKANRPELICPNCGAAFRVAPSHAKVRVYCSNTCRYAHKRGERGPNAGGGAWMRAEGNPRWTGSDWRERVTAYRERHEELAQWRRRVFARDRYICQRCGVSRAGHNQLRAHHVAPWATAPEARLDIDNGVTLCHDCHLWVHSKANTDCLFVA